MTSPQLRDATQVDPERLDAFLRTVYPAERCDFLKLHGDWWHQSGANRLVIEVDDRIAGYCAVIPARAWVAGAVRPALWWVDLVIAPEFRGQGLQSLFDRRVREMADLLLGFPNELAAKIHRKHGWGVRSDLAILMLPLRPARVKPLQRLEGMRGWTARTAAWFLEPLAWVWRALLRRRRMRDAWRMERFDSEVLAEVFERSAQQEISTTWRDAAYFDWRYGKAPFPGEYDFYLAGPPGRPTHFLIARHLTQTNGLRYTRVLDLYGDFDDLPPVRELLLMAVQAAVAHGSSQVTIASPLPGLLAQARRLGFLIAAPISFCWLSDSEQMMAALGGPICWSLGDSDNDAPD